MTATRAVIRFGQHHHADLFGDIVHHPFGVRDAQLIAHVLQLHQTFDLIKIGQKLPLSDGTTLRSGTIAIPRPQPETLCSRGCPLRRADQTAGPIAERNSLHAIVLGIPALDKFPYAIRRPESWSTQEQTHAASAPANCRLNRLCLPASRTALESSQCQVTYVLSMQINEFSQPLLNGAHRIS